MVEFIKVSKSFGAIKALDDVSFKVEDGEFVFIVGPTGSGKTTLLRLLLGEFRPSSGTIMFNNQDITKIKTRDLPKLRKKIGVVFQDFKLLSERTIRENVEIPLAIHSVETNKWEERLKTVLELVGLSDRADLFPSQLSGGEIQRAAIARALIVNPDLIFADEPTGNLDWETAEGIMTIFRKINEQGKTVIISSHHKDLIAKIGKRVLTLKEGKIISDTKMTGKTRKEKQK